MLGELGEGGAFEGAGVGNAGLGGEPGFADGLTGEGLRIPGGEGVYSPDAFLKDGPKDDGADGCGGWPVR